MSGLEKFQANKAWRAKVKKLLIMQRNPTTPAKVPVECERFSLDLEKDLQVLVQKKASCEKSDLAQAKYVDIETNLESKIFEMENEENYRPEHNTTIKRIPNNFSTQAFCDDTILDYQQQTLQWQRTSDESFMAMEQMCDKTASDPNSTLFQYMHSENKSIIVEDLKKRSADGNHFKTTCKKELQEIDEEAQSLQRLLLDLCVQEQKQLENETPLKGVDVTQLEDIEAPSKLWDSTIVGDTTLKTSPVKMVGLLRPSTIIEENIEDQSNNTFSEDDDVSSRISFKSAVKGSETSSTSYYETAHESTGVSAASKISDSSGKPVSEEMLDSQDLDKSIELINLDKTLEEPQNEIKAAAELPSETNIKEIDNNVKGSVTSSFDDSVGVIELLSDDEVDKMSPNVDKNRIVKNKISTDPKSYHIKDLNKIECSKNSINLEESFENDKENRSIFDESNEKSLHFNDTMEEVEYMMKKGMQYMAAAEPIKFAGDTLPMVKAVKTLPLTIAVKPLQQREMTFTRSPKKTPNINDGSPSKRMIHGKPTAVVTGTKAKTPYSSSKRTPLSSVQKTNPFVMSMKPLPKLELFKKPASAIPTRLKEPSSSNKFSHIVSPVGAYMKNTATTPLMSNLKQRSERPDVHNATVFRELEHESRIYQPKFGLTGNTCTKTSSLPKKAYISSEFKHIVDERTPVTIPGGKKIQKYLENAMLATVVRHEGKLKMPAKDVNRKTLSNNKSNIGNTTVQRNNGSLANLSLMSGDISVYTMKDARKF